MYEKVKAVMDARGMSTYALAKKTGIGSNHLYRAFAGHITLFPGWKTRIAEALDMKEEDLFSDKPIDKKEMIAGRIAALKEELAMLEKEYEEA